MLNILSINPETGELSLKDTFSHKQTSVLEFVAGVVDKNGVSLQNDSGMSYYILPNFRYYVTY